MVKSKCMIDKELSNKIKITSFLCTIMVLYRHSLNYLAFFNSLDGFGINKLVQSNFLKFTEIAVPYFFIISGFFFFQRDYYTRYYKKMISKKFKTLFIPFVFWNAICFIPFYLVNKAGLNLSCLSIIVDLFESRMNTPMWYVRDLIILMAIVPVYFWVFRLNKWWLYFLVFIVLVHYWIPIDTDLMSSEAMLFFFIGGILSRHRFLINNKLNNKYLMIFLLLWVLTSLYNDVLYIHKFNILIGVFTFWNITNHIFGYLKETILSLASYSFIIYASHSYIIKFLKNVIANMFYGNEIVALITFLMLPLVTCFLIIRIARVWKEKSIVTYNIVTGDR